MTVRDPAVDPANLRLEVEADPLGPVNLIANPSGELGGFGWVTPGEGCAAVSTYWPGIRQWLTYIYGATGGSGQIMYSDPLDVAAGQYAAAAWVSDPGAGSFPTHHRARLEWLDAAQVQIGQTAWTATTNVSGLKRIAPVLAPAGTLFARLAFEMSGDGTYPFPFAGGRTEDFEKITVAAAATAAELGSIRRNLIPNPSIETNTAGWTAWDVPATLSRSTTLAAVGASSLAVSVPAGGQLNVGTTRGAAGMPVVRNRDYTAQVRIRPSTTARTARLHLVFYDTSGKQVGHQPGPLTPETAGAWLTLTVTATAPSTATRAAVGVAWRDTAAGEIHYLDAALLELGTTVGTYFDGSTPDVTDLDYAWTGAAHASASTASYAFLTGLGQREWVNLADVAGEISIVRSELDLGTLTATFADPSLDPAVSGGILRPGRRVQLLTRSADTGVFEPLFAGETGTPVVEYDTYRLATRPGDPKHARITLPCVDAVKQLSSHLRPAGVATVDDLPSIIEGTGVPWIVNGSRDQAPTMGYPASSNENATALDQIAITRDSTRAHAWVDRYGQIQVWDAAELAPPNGTLDDGITGWTSGNATLAHETALTHQGPGALRVTNTTAGATSCLVSGPKSPARPGLSYTASAWVRCATVARSIGVSVEFFDVDDARITVTPLQFPTGLASTTEWQERTEAAVAPPGTASVQVAVCMFGTIGAGEVWYIDTATGWTPILDDSVYSAPEVDYDIEKVVNEVRIRYLRYVVPQGGEPGKTEEILYGPYRDDASIQEWGRRPADFTMHAATESGSAIAAHAAAILAANAQPRLQVTSVDIPVRRLDHITAARALLDLQDLVRVVYPDKALDQLSRVASITHAISSTRGWVMRVGFVAAGTVASPQQPPALAASSAGAGLALGPPFSSRRITSALSVPTATFTLVPYGSTLTADTGIAFSAGIWFVERPGIYLITASAVFAANATGRRIMRLVVNNSEEMRNESGAPGAQLVTVTCSYQRRLALNDQVAVEVWQNSGAALSLVSGQANTNAQVTWIGE